MSRSRRRSRIPVLTAVLALVAAAGGAAAVARSGRRPSLPSRPSLPPLPGPLARLGGRSRPGSEDWRCACGARYRATGIDRHRVFWPAGASEDQPVLGTECVECGRPLPA